MKKNGLLTLLFTLAITASAWAQDPNALKSQANNQVVTASQLMERARAVLQQSPNPAGRNAAIAILVEAGQMFEQSAGIYQALMPKYATQEDVDNARKAMQSCVQQIQQLQQGQ